VVLNFLLIPAYGINGAAIATTISLLTVRTLTFAEVYAITRIQPMRLNYAKVIFSSFISLTFVYAITKFLKVENVIYVLVLMFMLYIGIYFILLLVLRTFEEGDVVIMKAIETKTGLKSKYMRNIIGRFL